MLKYYVILFFFAFQISNSQSLFEEYKDFYTISGGKKSVDLEHLKKWGFKDVLEYNKKAFQPYKDSTLILSKIKFASISFKDSLNLEQAFEDLKLLPNLEYLQLKNIFFLEESISNITFPENIKELKNLKTLDFYGTFDWDFNGVFNTISALPKLKNLMLRSGNKNILLYENIAKLSNLEGLLVTGRYGPKFPKNMDPFNKLTSLIISADEYPNGYEELKKITLLNKIENLSLIYIPITDSLSNVFKEFRGLRKISISGKMIHASTILKNIGKNNNITELYLANNELVRIPMTIKYFPKLEVLESINNDLSHRLPTVFYRLENIKSIVIEGSTLTKIDSRLTDLKSLQYLKLDHNDINSFPSKIGALRKLEILELHHNKIKELPEDIGTLNNLKEVNISDNILYELPKSISKLEKLHKLYISNNFLTLLPTNFGDLKNVQILNLENNNLISLPESFGDLTNLENLNLLGNNLEGLPDSFKNLKKLKKLTIEDKLLPVFDKKMMNKN